MCQGGVVTDRVSKTYSRSTSEAGVNPFNLNIELTFSPRIRYMTRASVILPAVVLALARNVNDSRNVLAVDVFRILIGLSALARGVGELKTPAKAKVITVSSTVRRNKWLFIEKFLSGKTASKRLNIYQDAVGSYVGVGGNRASAGIVDKGRGRSSK